MSILSVLLLSKCNQKIVGRTRVLVTASPQVAAAIELMRQKIQDLGFDGVHLEPDRT
jgi:hypothetical protein